MRPPWSYNRDQLPVMVTRARLKMDSGMVLYMMGALNVFTPGGPGLRQTSVGEVVIGLSVNEVLSADGVGSEASKRDQGSCGEGAIEGMGIMIGSSEGPTRVGKAEIGRPVLREKKTP